MQRVGIADGDIDRVGAAVVEVADQLAIGVVTALTQHQHRGTIGELGVMDHAAIAVDDVFGEPKHRREPIGHRLGILAAQGRVDAGRFDVVRHGRSPPWLTAPSCTRQRGVGLKVCYQSASPSPA
ncbi:hypothetical protein J2R96_003872 [Bradyrhizobium elkanii]|nr:hypothetical protein [Bradyrhizobium elkanii]